VNKKVCFAIPQGIILHGSKCLHDFHVTIYDNFSVILVAFFYIDSELLTPNGFGPNTLLFRIERVGTWQARCYLSPVLVFFEVFVIENPFD
jgi:hypothetical protein